MSFNPEYFFPTVITTIPSLNGGQFGIVKGTDIYPAVDVTDVTQSPQGTTKPYQISQLATYILQSFGYYMYAPVQAMATANLNATYNNGVLGVGATLTNAGALAPFSVDVQIGVVGQRYLIPFQTAALQNGIYVLTTAGDSVSVPWVLTRSIDFNQPNSAVTPPPNGIIEDGIVNVLFGAVYAGTYWQDTFIEPVTVGSTAIYWAPWTFVPAQFNWIVVTAPSANALVNTGYVANRATQVQILLPAGFGVGDEVIVMGLGSGGWSLLTNAGQTIQFGSYTASHYISSDIQYANITVRGLVPGTTWEVISVNSNPTFS